MKALVLHTLGIFSPTAINQKSWQKQPCMLLLPVMLWGADFHIRKHADHKEEISPTPSGVESIGYRGGEGAAGGGTDEMGNRKAQEAMTSFSMLPLLILKCKYFFLKKLHIIHKGLFSAGRLQSSLLWQCPQGESRCPLPATHLHTPSIPTPSLARQWSRPPPPPPLEPKKRRRRRGGGRKESYFLKTSAHSIKNCEMEGLNFSLRVQRLKWTSLISHSLINSLQMTREVRPDYSFSKGSLNSVKKREKTSTKLLIKLFVIITLCISPKDTRARLNLFVLGSLIRLSSPSNCPARLELNRANPHIVKWTIG